MTAKRTTNDEGGNDFDIDELKPASFPLVSEADVALDMDMVVEFMEDDEYVWEEDFGGDFGQDWDGTSTDSDELGWESG